MFIMISAAHAGLILFSVLRSFARPSKTKTRYVYAPRTSFQIGRLMGRARDDQD